MSTPVAPVPPFVAGSPQAFDIYRQFAADPRTTAPVLILGNGGTGKSAFLGALRNILRASNIQSSESICSFDPRTHSALLVDDAHLLSAGELQQLAALTNRDQLLVVVASQRRYDDVHLTGMLKLFESAGTVVELTPLNEQGIASAARAQFGTPVNYKFARNLLSLTEGLSYLVDAALNVADPRIDTCAGELLDRVVSAVRSTVADRLQRLTHDALEGLALEVIGADLDDVELAAILGVEPHHARVAAGEAQTCGLMHRTGELGSIVAGELFRLVGRRQLEVLGRRLLEMRITTDSVSPNLAAKLAEWGVRDRRLCELLLDAAEDRARSQKESADDLYRAALCASETHSDLAIRRAEVAFQLRRFEEALGIIDGYLEHAVESALPAAARVAASTWCARGMLGRGAEIYSWVRPDRVGEDGPVAALLLACAGHPDEASAMTSSVGSLPPTSEVSGNRMLAEALLASLNGSGAATLNPFVRSLAVFGTSATNGVHPDSPVAVAAIAALHAGDLRRARKVLCRSLGSERNGSPTRVRHQLLLGWTAMLEGNLTAATTELTAIGETADLSLRDRFLADALRVGIARRRTGTGQIHVALATARESVDEYSVDLLSLLPVGELWAAASRIGKANEVRHLVDDAFSLLGRLGDPPFWASALHWYGVTVAIQSDSPAELTTHAHALGAAASQCEYAAALATAGRTWVRILTGDCDPAEICEAATGLQVVGMGWDGANLASRAALRCADNRLAAELLAIARTVGQPAMVVETAAGATPEDTKVLSDRQREVAALLVEGLTYKGVGARLFISPKTVEYHVAEIKRRIGTESRSELLSRLHALDLSSVSTGA